MKKILTILFLCFFIGSAYAETISVKDYLSKPYVGTEINKALNGPIPFVLVFVNPYNRNSILRYVPIGKMVYNEFGNKYDFCILNTTSPENREVIDVIKPAEFPAVYIVDPETNKCMFINKRYHNSKDMRRILNNQLKNEEK